MAGLRGVFLLTPLYVVLLGYGDTISSGDAPPPLPPGLRGGAQDGKPCTCPYCEASDVRVVDSRDAVEGIRRRRECHLCGQRFTTMEQVQVAALLVAKHRRPPGAPQSREGARRRQLACRQNAPLWWRRDGLVVAVEREVERMGRAEVPSALIGELGDGAVAGAGPRGVRALRQHLYRDFQDIENFATEVESLRQAPAAAVPAARRCRRNCLCRSTGGLGRRDGGHGARRGDGRSRRRRGSHTNTPGARLGARRQSRHGRCANYSNFGP